MQLAQIAHPTANLAKTGSAAELLRENGFVLKDRPDVGEAIWILGDEKYTQTAALAICEEGDACP